jgi:hypothetical protein
VAPSRGLISAIPRRSGRTILHLSRLPLRGGREVQGRECDAIRRPTSLLAIAARNYNFEPKVTVFWADRVNDALLHCG